MNNLIAILLISLTPFDFLEMPQEKVNSQQTVKEQENSKKVILYFTASWCGPCKSFKDKELPKLKELGLESSIGNDKEISDIEIYDVDIHSDFYKKMKKSDRFIPLFIFLDKDGLEYARLSGYQSAENIIKVWNTKK